MILMGARGACLWGALYVCMYVCMIICMYDGMYELLYLPQNFIDHRVIEDILKKLYFSSMAYYIAAN